MVRDRAHVLAFSQAPARPLSSVATRSVASAGRLGRISTASAIVRSQVRLNKRAVISIFFTGYRRWGMGGNFFNCQRR